MTRKTVVKGIALNVIIIVMVLALLGGLTFAWFATRQTGDESQLIEVGEFKVNLKDTQTVGDRQYLHSRNIEFTNAYPSKESVANNFNETSSDSNVENKDFIKGNKFIFKIANEGEIDALTSLKVITNDTANSANLEKVLKYHLYSVSEDTQDNSKITFTKLTNTANLLTDPTNGLEKSLITAMGGNVELPESEVNTTPRDSGLSKLVVGQSYAFCVVVWIDENATYGEGESDLRGGDNFEFALNMAAIQSVGGITASDTDKVWEGMPPQQWQAKLNYYKTINTDAVTIDETFTVKHAMNATGVPPYLDNAKIGNYANAIVINLNILYETAISPLSWDVAFGANNSLTVLDSIEASINGGTTVKGLANIAAALNAITLQQGKNAPITVVFWTAETADQDKVIELIFTLNKS